VIGFNAAHESLFLWPFGARRVGGLVGLDFLGGKHANFNMALWRRDVAATIGAEQLRAALAHLAGHADFIRLASQPLTWGGATNPFALLPHQRAANYGFSGALAPDFEALLRARTNADTRKKMRKKERTLAGFGELRFERATAPDDVRRVLDAFFKQKSARMRTLGVPDVFAVPGVRRFIEAAATEPLTNGKPSIELYALSVDDIIVATMGGIVGGGRFCAMFNSIIQGRFAAESPGEQLMLKLVRNCCERGLDTFDLGIGEARYKNLLCEDAEPLFDSYLSLSPAGRLLTVAFAFAASAKRAVKQRPTLWSLVRALRRMRARLSASPRS
jgi:CelD/BcsL family acetyltransferase involved in cellulose biosynthesis